MRFDAIEITPELRAQGEAAAERAEEDRAYRTEIRRQIGAGNLMAISGGRWEAISKGRHMIGVELPVTARWCVRVYLNRATDTYEVQRVRKLGPGKGTEVVATLDDFYCDALGRVARDASNYLEPWGGHEGGAE